MLDALVDSAAFREVYAPFVERVESIWNVTGLRSWTARDLELTLLLGVERGRWAMAGLRDWLTGDGGRTAREWLEFTHERSHRHLRVVNSLTVPSVATLSRYWTFVPHEARAAMARALFERLRDQALALSSVREASQILYVDSLDVFITGLPVASSTAASEDRRPRRHRRVEGAGRVGHRRNGKPAGVGFKIHDVTNMYALPLELVVTGIDVHDKTAAREQLLDPLEMVLARLGKTLRVIVGDAAYYGPDFLPALMKLGLVPCIHESSHGESPKTIDEVATKDAYAIPLEGTRWYANGHFELFCDCGAGTTAIDVALGKRGQAIIRTVAECDSCGSHTITANRWRLKQTSGDKRFVKRRLGPPGDPPETLRPALGNPLTYHSPHAAEYGKDRFGHNESLHGQLKRGYGVGGNNNPLPVESQAHLETVVYLIGALMWANAIERLSARAALGLAAFG